MKLFKLSKYAKQTSVFALCLGLASVALVISTGSINASNSTPSLDGRQIRIVSTSAAAGSQVTVLIELDSMGDEVAASFTLNFDPAILSSPVVGLGTDAPPGSTLSMNSNQTATGKLGLLIDSTNPFVATPPARQAVTVTFNVAQDAPLGPTAITFVTTPTPLSVSSPLGALLPTAYQVGTVTVTAPNTIFVTISGKVTTPNGQALRNTVVSLIDPNGARRTATTSSFGTYSFANVETGSTYTLTATSKRYRFSPKVVQLTDNVANLDFVGLE